MADPKVPKKVEEEEVVEEVPKKKECDEGCPCEDHEEIEEFEEGEEHEHDGCCDHDHLDGHMHESDPNDPVTAICAKINKDLETWDENGTLTKDKLNEALDNFDAALKMTSMHMDALLGKAYVQGELGKSEEAVETLLQALKVDPEDIRVHTMLGQLGDFGLGDGEGDFPDLDIIERYMDVKGTPTPKFKAALTAIFMRFSVGEDEDPNKRSITKACMDKFHHFVNGGPLNEDAIQFLFSGEWALNKDGHLTLDGFIDFYLNQTFTDPAETVSDMKKLGYDEELNPISSAAPSSTSAASVAATPTASKQ